MGPTRTLSAKLFAFGAVAFLGLATVVSAALAVPRSVRDALRSRGALLSSRGSARVVAGAGSKRSAWPSST